MTSENRLIVGIEDIKSLTLECNKCKVRLTYSLTDNVGTVPFGCPNCNVEWRAQEHSHTNEPKMPALLKFISAVYMIRFRQKENEVEPKQQLGFRILLEFDGPH